eukprot:1393297-Pleurochrysis_carterae.AAC.1
MHACSSKGLLHSFLRVRICEYGGPPPAFARSGPEFSAPMTLARQRPSPRSLSPPLFHIHFFLPTLPTLPHPTPLHSPSPKSSSLPSVPLQAHEFLQTDPMISTSAYNFTPNPWRLFRYGRSRRAACLRACARSFYSALRARACVRVPACAPLCA